MHLPSTRRCTVSLSVEVFSVQTHPVSRNIVCETPYIKNKSFLSQMDLVCDKKMSRSHAQTATMIGYLSGSAISSVPSDM